MTLDGEEARLSSFIAGSTEGSRKLLAPQVGRLPPGLEPRTQGLPPGSVSEHHTCTVAPTGLHQLLWGGEVTPRKAQGTLVTADQAARKTLLHGRREPAKLKAESEKQPGSRSQERDVSFVNSPFCSCAPGDARRPRQPGRELA